MGALPTVTRLNVPPHTNNPTSESSYKMNASRIAASLALASALAGGGTAAATTVKPRPLAPPSRPALMSISTYTTARLCRPADGSKAIMCVWDARRSGSGIGRSMLNIDYGDAYAYIATPPKPVTRKAPLKVVVHSVNNSPVAVTVSQGRTVLARKAHLYSR